MQSSKDELGLSLTSLSLREHPVFFGATTGDKSAVRRLHLSLRRKNGGTKFTGCQKIELQSSLNLGKRLASDHLFRISPQFSLPLKPLLSYLLSQNVVT